ncbi:MAG TPA: hypothetical protein ENN35_09395 [Deltaproteobacteria bacterium]|nr:hypothetical protein [Deltaproteobacteria bacterium]
MNIFILDRNIRTCARYHADRHVVKMILESAQILCTIVSREGLESSYRPTHRNHPCVLWAGRSRENWLWLKELTLRLNDEYRYRFGRSDDHSSAVVVRDLECPSLPGGGLTEFVQAMPEQYRVPGDAVSAYRAYYVGEKSEIARWTRRRIPRWYREALARTEKKRGVTG